MAGSHVLITGEPHSDQERLAHIVHAISLFRGCPLVALDRAPGTRDTPDPEGAQRDLALHWAATVLCDLGDNRARLDPALTSRLFLPEVPDPGDRAGPHDPGRNRRARRALAQMTHVRLAPLSSRRGAIHRLLDGMFEERGSSLRVRAITPQNRATLAGHRWPQDFASLREAADRLIVIAREPSLRRAALALRVPPATFHHWFANIVGLELPLLADARTLASQGAES